MKSVLSAFILFISISESYAQRYVQEIFSNVDKETITYYKDRGLEMDVYQPSGDNQEGRPLLVYVHGGGFAGGRRDEPAIISFCEDLARRGYVVASLSYTLTMMGKSFGCDQPAANKLETFRQSGEEINFAVKYFIEHKNKFRINPEHIVLAGSSAGAEAVVHAAYWPATHQPLPANFKYAGLISMAGAIYDLSLITTKTAMPTMFFHGTCDNLVPYGTAPHHYCKENTEGYLMLHGAASMAEKLKSLHIGYYLLTGCNDGHEWNSIPFHKNHLEIAQFIFSDVIGGKFRQHHEIIKTDRSCKLIEAPVVCNN